MSKFDRCKICDYNEVEGSVYADVPPGARGRVALYPALDGFFCTECVIEQHTNLVDLTFTDDVDELDKKAGYNRSIFRAKKEFPADA